MRLLVVVIAMLASVTEAGGHARLVRSDPISGAVLAAERIVLEFDSEVERRYARLVLDVADGTQRALRIDGRGLTRRIEIAIGALPAGAHVLRWSVVSRDGHRVAGTLRFATQ